MATLFTATSPSHHRFVSPSQHPKQSLPSQPLRVTFTENPEPAAAVTLQEQQMTDWIASRVTRRFGIGAGFTWAGFLAFGVVSEQMNKSRLEVLQREDNIRLLINHLNFFVFKSEDWKCKWMLAIRNRNLGFGTSRNDTEKESGTWADSLLVMLSSSQTVISGFAEV